VTNGHRVAGAPRMRDVELNKLRYPLNNHCLMITIRGEKGSRGAVSANEKNRTLPGGESGCAPCGIHRAGGGVHYNAVFS